MPPGAGIDADILVKVASYPADTNFCRSSLAAALPVVFETLTRRAIFGQIWVCQILPKFDFSGNLATVVHELIHIVVRPPPLTPPPPLSPSPPHPDASVGPDTLGVPGVLGLPSPAARACFLVGASLLRAASALPPLMPAR